MNNCSYLKVNMKGILAAKDARLEDLARDLESKVTRLEALELKFEELKVENKEQQSLIVALQQQINRRSHSKTVANPGLEPVAAARAMPQNCEDLYKIGHYTGIHLVMGEKQVESVYCDFTKLPTDLGKVLFEYFICYVD